MDDRIKMLKCEKCGFVKSTNKLGDNRFYCPNCNRNLGCYVDSYKMEKLTLCKNCGDRMEKHKYREIRIDGKK